MSTPLHIGFIPLIDAAALIVAVDKGFTKAEGLDVTLAREVSWSNVRDKLNIGLFDAAHLLAPVAIASSLGLGHVKVPIVAPFNLGLNGNAITVSPALHAAILSEVEGDPFDPMATAQALARVVAARRRSGLELVLVSFRLLFLAIASQLALCHVTLPRLSRYGPDRLRSRTFGTYAWSASLSKSASTAAMSFCLRRSAGGSVPAKRLRR